MNEKRKQLKKKKYATAGEPYPITRAVTHIRLLEVKKGKLAALDALTAAYLALCQQYVTLFCTEEPPDKLRDPLYPTPLSERWQRVAIMQAAGIAKSWCTNHANASQQYQEDLLQYQEKRAQGTLATSSRTGKRLMRHVKQEINRAVNQCFVDPEHEGAQFAYEQLSVASMRFKARAQNAYLRASNLGRIPQQIVWKSQKRGVLATPVKSAYSSQECSVCHYTDRKNRPNQQTFCCQVCGFEAHADDNAAINISRRVGDGTLRACKNRTAIKAMLMTRHGTWRQEQGMGDIGPVKRRRRGKSSDLTSFA